jgi:phosphoglycolate phosphatase
LSEPAHRFRLIVFDVDGTLVDSQRAIFSAMAMAFAEHGLPEPDPAEVRRQVGLSVEETMAQLVPAGDGGLLGRLAGSFRQAAFALRRSPDYSEPLYPGIRDLLESLVHPDVFFGIATGKARRGLDRTLGSHGIADLFHTLQTADRNPSKPHPAMLVNAMAAVGVEARQTVFVGDTSFDMNMALSAGASAIGVAWGYHATQDLRAAGAQRIIGQPGELPEALSSMGG